jgi:hypothetical protein
MLNRSNNRVLHAALGSNLEVDIHHYTFQRLVALFRGVLEAGNILAGRAGLFQN